jgi:hypothetical protein
MATSWFDCDVVQAGPGGDNRIRISLSDRATPKKFDNQFFHADTQPVGRANQMLATALAALTSGTAVSAELDSDHKEFSIIHSMLLRRG